MDAFQAFSADLRAGPQWVYWWVNFMGIVIMLAVPFAFTRIEARWTLLAMIFVAPMMIWMHSQFGMQRILGLPHVIFWTPLAVYLWTRRDKWRVAETLGGKWIALLFTVIIVSLVMDYADVARFLMGARA